MTEQQFLEICKGRYASLSKLKAEGDFYEYEKQFAEVMQGLNRELLEKSISSVSTDRRKKKRSASTEQ